MADQPPQFGTRLPDRESIPRPGVYAVAFRDDGLLLVVRGPTFGMALPGGGIDDGESHMAALQRELREETGYAVTVGTCIGRANQYVESLKDGRWYNKVGTFYHAKLGVLVADPTEPDHTVVWLEPCVAVRALYEGSHRWAVQQALDGCGRDADD